MVSAISKYAVMINEPGEIAFHLEKAFYIAQSGRPGPVWLDILMDVQSAVIEANELSHFNDFQSEPVPSSDKCAKGARNIGRSGCTSRRAQNELAEFAAAHQIPVATPYLGVGVMPTTNPLYAGVIGIRGARAGNYTVQNADLLLVLGSSLSISSTRHECELFAPNAHTVVVDIDPVEHAKNTVRIDTLIISDLKEFFRVLPEFDHKTDSVWPPDN